MRSVVGAVALLLMIVVGLVVLRSPAPKPQPTTAPAATPDAPLSPDLARSSEDQLDFFQEKYDRLSAAYARADVDEVMSYHAKDYKSVLLSGKTRSYRQLKSDMSRSLRPGAVVIDTEVLEVVKRGNRYEVEIAETISSGARTKISQSVDTWRRSRSGWRLVRHQVVESDWE